jgi:hypothetical protein
LLKFASCELCNPEEADWPFECTLTMKLFRQIEPDDIAKVKDFFDRYKENPFVKRRIVTNLNDDKPQTTKEAFWEVMISCLLTTQQRSGPDSSVTRFILTKPFPLRYELCCGQADLDSFVTKVLSDFGGLRRSPTLAGKRKQTPGTCKTAAGLRPCKVSKLCVCTQAGKLSGTQHTLLTILLPVYPQQKPN